MSSASPTADEMRSMKTEAKLLLNAAQCVINAIDTGKPENVVQVRDGYEQVLQMVARKGA